MEYYLSPTIRDATESSAKHVDGHGQKLYRLTCTKGQNAGNINMSSVYSHLIQEAGRWTLDYASDLLYDIKAIADYIKDPQTDTAYFPIGIRRNGVDGYNFIIGHLLDTKAGLYPYVYPEKVYNRLLSVKITRSEDGISVELYDIIHNVTQIDENDLPKNREKASE